MPMIIQAVVEGERKGEKELEYELLAALVGIDHTPEHLATVCGMLEKGDNAERLAAISILGAWGEPGSLTMDSLIGGLADADPEVVICSLGAIETVAGFGHDCTSAKTPLLETFRRADSDLEERVLETLVEIGVNRDELVAECRLKDAAGDESRAIIRVEDAFSRCEEERRQTSIIKKKVLRLAADILQETTRDGN